MNKTHCRGCNDDFYNGKNDLGVKECWSFKDAKIVERKRVPLSQPPPWTHRSEQLPHCYTQKGYAIFNGNPTGWKG